MTPARLHDGRPTHVAQNRPSCDRETIGRLFTRNCWKIKNCLNRRRRWGRRRKGVRGGARLSRRSRKVDSKHAAPPEAGRRNDRPTMGLGDPLTDRQAEPEPAALGRSGARAVRSPEPLEDVGQVGGRDPDAGIAD